ncbi:conjugative transposon protein TraM [Pedobacter namyangjuensis]|uniref:conjugative transposon protein TraM n=1 Tax=Pedobacter namyangjuensis TaxID=600626 RepID=UPI000DE40A7A|nr:conjugative transposon protein TraM [Pedobacter namyangjuensis]
METKITDKRKILLFLPLLVLPFLALGFYAGGGGRAKASGALKEKGISTELPQASFKVAEPVDKMGFYAKGEKDTSRSNGLWAMAESIGLGSSGADEKTMEINARLQALNREINLPASDPKLSGGVVEHPGHQRAEQPGISRDVDRLEALMDAIKADKGSDPEMEQLNQVLEKLLDVQQPMRSQQKNSSALEDESTERSFLALPAELAEGGKVVHGATLKLRLLDSATIKGVLIPKGHFVFGLCRLVNQRLLLDIKNIRLGEMIIPVELTMYALDGMPGIPAPEAVFNQAAGSGAVDASSGISLYGMDGIAGQVAGAGIDAAKKLFSGKMKLVRVKLKAGQKVLLRNNRP